jgi:seipin
MLRFRSLPIRLMNTFFTGLPILLGICTETQKLTIEILCYTESRHRTNTISIKLKPRAGIGDLPQMYTSKVKIRTQLPWMKQLVYNWKWTLYVWTTFYVHGFILIQIACYLKPSVFGLTSWLPTEKPSDVERERKKAIVREREERGQLTEKPRKWRDRMNKRRRRMEHQRVSLSEGCQRIPFRPRFVSFRGNETVNEMNFYFVLLNETVNETVFYFAQRMKRLTKQYFSFR